VRKWVERSVEEGGRSEKHVERNGDVDARGIEAIIYSNAHTVEASHRRIRGHGQLSKHCGERRNNASGAWAQGRGTKSTQPEPEATTLEV